MPTFPFPFTARLSPEYIRIYLNLVKSGLITHFAISHIGTIKSLAGPSMLPTISVSGDWAYTNNLYARGNGIRVGDVVNFAHPSVLGEGGCKRVMGLGGDFVWDGGEGRGRMIQVPEGHCWVLGDNLSASRDSRTFGPVPLALIRGKITARVWPLSAVGWIKNTLQQPEEAI